jgi:eukaryotic-like serine/threonine-protein kinase
MTDAGWVAIERLFERARELTPAARAAFLDAECADDAGLRRRLEKLLAAHDGGRGGFLESLDPYRAAALLDAAAPKPETIGRYVIERRLGRGGMGVVYLARDPALDRPVAVKLLSPELGADERAARRLMAEARAASALDHPNIGTVYEIGRSADGRPFIAMAYLEGVTVRDRLAGGPLPVDEAVAIAAQVADGLAAAHASGIVHRDIKPENLIIAGDGRVRILDFGIARMAAGTLTVGGGTAGTVSYMSPEQTRGDPVDGRADTWALGVVLYEMLTGERPFRGDAHAAVIHGIRHDSPDPVTARRPDVPAAVAAAVARCLEKDPERRFAAAEDLTDALRGARAGAGAAGTSHAAGPRAWLPAAGYIAGAWFLHRVLSAVPATAGLPRWVPSTVLALLAIGLVLVLATTIVQASASGWLRRRLTWPRARLAGTLALVLLVAAATGHVVLRTAGIGPLATLTSRGVLGDRDPIVLADFAAATADPRIGRVVTEALRIDLHQSPTLRLAEPGEVVAALRRIGRDPADGLTAEAARELALRDGFKAVIAGEVAELGGGYVLTARVMDTDGTTLTAVREAARDSTALIDAIDRLSKRIRERIGESLRTLHAAEPLPRVATASLPALRQYADARRLAWAGGDDARIAELLEQAVALDTVFAAAHRALATTYWNLRADRARTVAATRTAYELRDRLSERERYLTEAAWHWQVLGDPHRARESYARVLAIEPDNAVARTNLGLALLFEGDAVEAERVLGAGLGPGAPVALQVNFARALYFQGRSEAAIEALDSVTTADGSVPAAAELLRVRVLGGDGRWQEAESVATAVLERYGADAQVRAESLRMLWHLALVRGRITEAERHYAELVSALERIGALDALVRAVVQRAETQRTLLGDPAAARATLHALLGRPALDILSVGATAAPRVAAALAAIGDTTRAARLVAEWEALPDEARGDPDSFSPELARARMDLHAGRYEGAIERLERASAGTIQAINYLPDLGRAYRDAGRLAAAIAALERYLEFRHTRRVHRVPGHLGPALIELATLHEATGDTAKALAAHARLVELWGDADAALQPHVRHATRRMTELSDLHVP